MLQRSLFLRPAGSIRTFDRGGGGGDGRGEEEEEGGEEEEEEAALQEVQEELGEGAAFQLALPDGGFTEHGLRLRHPALRCVHGGDGGAPVQQQQSMMGHGVCNSSMMRTRTTRSTETSGGKVFCW